MSGVYAFTRPGGVGVTFRTRSLLKAARKQPNFEDTTGSERRLDSLRLHGANQIFLDGVTGELN